MRTHCVHLIEKDILIPAEGSCQLPVLLRDSEDFIVVEILVTLSCTVLGNWRRKLI